MRHFSKICYKDFIRNGATKCDRKIHFGLLKFIRHQYLFEADDLFFLIRYFDTDGTLTWDRRDDPYTEGRKIERDIIFKVFDFRNSYSRSRDDFIKGYSRAYGRSDFSDLDFVVHESLYDLIFVGFEFSPVYFKVLICIIMQ